MGKAVQKAEAFHSHPWIPAASLDFQDCLSASITISHYCFSFFYLGNQYATINYVYKIINYIL